MYFSWATDLDPKGVNSQIKEAILSPGQGEEESLMTQSGNYQEITIIFFVGFHVEIVIEFLKVDEPTRNSSTEQDGEVSGEVSGEGSNVADNATSDAHAEDSDDSLWSLEEENYEVRYMNWQWLEVLVRKLEKRSIFQDKIISILLEGRA